jgi:hypothetical protein
MMTVKKKKSQVPMTFNHNFKEYEPTAKPANIKLAKQHGVKAIPKT